MPAADRKSPLRPPVRTPAANAHVIPVTTRLLGMIPAARNIQFCHNFDCFKGCYYD